MKFGFLHDAEWRNMRKLKISKNIDVKTNIMILILNVFFGRQCQDHMNWNDMILKE